MNSLESKDPKLPMKRQKGSEEKLPKLRLMRGKRQELSPRRKKERLTGWDLWPRRKQKPWLTDSKSSKSKSPRDREEDNRLNLWDKLNSKECGESNMPSFTTISSALAWMTQWPQPTMRKTSWVCPKKKSTSIASSTSPSLQSNSKQDLASQSMSSWSTTSMRWESRSQSSGSKETFTWSAPKESNAKSGETASCLELAVDMSHSKSTLSRTTDTSRECWLSTWSRVESPLSMSLSALSTTERSRMSMLTALRLRSQEVEDLNHLGWEMIDPRLFRTGFPIEKELLLPGLRELSRESCSIKFTTPLESNLTSGLRSLYNLHLNLKCLLWQLLNK